MASSGYAEVYVPTDHAGGYLSHLCECAVDPAAVQSCTGWLLLRTDGEDVSVRREHKGDQLPVEWHIGEMVVGR